MHLDDDTFFLFYEFLRISPLHLHLVRQGKAAQFTQRSHFHRIQLAVMLLTYPHIIQNISYPTILYIMSLEIYVICHHNVIPRKCIPSMPEIGRKCVK